MRGFAWKVRPDGQHGDRRFPHRGQRGFRTEESVHRMIRVRGSSALPRVGVSFTVEKANRADREAFVQKWIGVVDVIRIGECYEVDGSVQVHDQNLQRVPCGHLYHTMPIHYNGNVSICCLDGFQSQIMGNVFEDGGVKAVWHGEKFQEMRHYHETGQYDKVPFCKNCNVWA
jgi:radical SAM protein with 4Fe4S-binding SPASM domain